MKTITTTAQIASDGILRLERPTGLSPGPAEVVIVVQPTLSHDAASPRGLSGKYAGHSPADFDAVAAVRAVRRQATREALELPE